MRVKAETQLNAKMSLEQRRQIEQYAEKLGVTVSYLLREGGVFYGQFFSKQRGMFQE